MATSVRSTGSGGDRTRFCRLSLVIIEELTQILRDLLLNEVCPTQIFNEVNQRNICNTLRPEQVVIINNANTRGYLDFDITLLYTLLRNVCQNITPPSQNWGVSTMPSPKEVTVGDDIERIRLIRNKLFGHISEAAISDTEFKTCWSIISDICTRMQALLNKDYVKRLQSAKDGSIDSDTENKYIELIKRLANEEKTIRDLIQELISKETVEMKSRVAKEGEIVETLIDMSILGLNKMVDAVNEMISEADVNLIYESIAEFMRHNKEEPEKGPLQNLLKKLSEKITSYAELQGPNKIKILANFSKFSLRMRIEYGANVKFSRSSILLLVTFSSKKRFDLYKKDLENGRIGEQIMELFLYPPLLERFGLKAEDIELSLNGTLLTQHKATMDNIYEGSAYDSVSAEQFKRIHEAGTLTKSEGIATMLAKHDFPSRIS